MWRNIFLGRELTNKYGLLDVKRMKQETHRLMTQSMGFTSSAVNPDSKVGTFSGGERQGVAIVRALYFDADIIILDEPTMGLSLKETQKLLNFVREYSRGRQICRLYRSQYLPRVCSRRSGGGHRSWSGGR